MKRLCPRIIAVAIGVAALVAPASTVAALPVTGGRYPLIQPEHSGSDWPDRSGLLQASAGGRALTSMPAFGTCAAAPGKTVLLTAESRVYKNWGVDELGDKDLYAYGCIFGGRAIALGVSSGSIDGSLEQFRLVGPYVSFVAKADDETGLEETLGVVDLRGIGRTLRTIAPSPLIGGENDFAATPLLSSRGASAWVADSCAEGSCTGPYEVWIADRAGPRRVDRGAGTDPESLALHRGRVTWTDDGVRRAAAIGAGDRGRIGGGRSP
jgi:hypothetical protein